MIARCVPCTLLAAATAFATGAAEFTARDRQPTPAELALLPAVIPEKADRLIREVRAPEGFDVTIFATPPAVNYPVFLSAAPEGTLFVSSDGNGSLDRKPHLGRVLRVRDTDGDGRADEVKAFVTDVNSPRGLVWDGDRLYLLHPPDISVYFDQDGDGVADEEQTLVKGIAFTFKDRPADHSSNGLELGIDGWIYAAIGDFGFLEAQGADGRRLQFRGGGVIRVRPDGTGLEAWARGTRNILEVAVSPLLDAFARDNTNDGGGWDVRFHHFSGLTRHGYPRLFKNFSDEIIQPLADYGGGSGCGAAWIGEPGIPDAWNHAPFTADWGRERVYHHGLTPKGATFTATQEEFLRLPRATDLDIDGKGAIYASSWKGASFTWVGPEVGFLVRVTPHGYRPDPLPDFEHTSAEGLVELLASPSHRRRLAAQRTLLHRENGNAARRVASPLSEMAADSHFRPETRVAALFALKQALGPDANAILNVLGRDPTIAPWAFRALGDRPDQPAGVDTRLLTGGLGSSDARTRKEAVIALARLQAPDATNALVPLMADPDPVVAHTTVQALIALRAIQPCLEVLDRDETSSNENPTLRTGALRVLQSFHEPALVDALLQRLARPGSAERRHALLTALCRLYYREGDWKGDSWGTRPDTRGPYYQPEPWSETPRIAATLRAAVERADSHEAAFLGQILARHRIPAEEALDKLISIAEDDPSLLPSIAAQLAQADSIPVKAVPLLVRIAASAETSDADRAQAVVALTRSDQPQAWRAVLQALPRVRETRTENHLAEMAQRAFDTAPHLGALASFFDEEAARADSPSSLLAETALFRLASGKAGRGEVRSAANRALDRGWMDARRRIQILRAAAEARDASRAAQFVAALADPDPEIARTARATLRRLRIDPADFTAAAPPTPKLSDLALDQVLEEVTSLHGARDRGEQLFSELSCVGCHTVRADEPLKGPYLGTIATTYKRRELADAILEPSKNLAQGFVTQRFELKDGTEIDGFVVQEAADAVTIRTVAAQEQQLPISSIASRSRQDRSIMPDGLVAGLTLREFASLLDFLEDLSKASKAAP